LAEAVCPFCGEKFDTGEILMDMRLKRHTFEHKTVTGYQPCPKCKKLAGNLSPDEVDTFVDDSALLGDEDGLEKIEAEKED
jgi:ssDNA-binding Zn-finger/Zn-ribbon topoisomerase 1